MAIYASTGIDVGGANDADTTYVAGHSYSVQHCISQFATTGDTITLTGASHTWATGVTCNISITLQGLSASAQNTNGAPTTLPCVVSWPKTAGNAITVNSATASSYFRLTGIHFSGLIQESSNPPVYLSISGSRTSDPYRIDNCFFDATTLSNVLMINLSGNGPGLFDHCQFTASDGSEMVHNLGYGPSDTEGWTQDVTPGDSSPVFFENCIGTHPAGAFPEGCSMLQSYYGARTVVRFCVLNQCQIDQHGTTGNIGARWWEFYNNTYNQPSAAAGSGSESFMAIRAGSGVIYNNTANMQGGFKAGITLYSDDASPCKYGPGAGIFVGGGLNGADNNSPVYLWGNATSCAIGTQAGEGGTNDIALGRNFISVTSGTGLHISQTAAQAAGGGATYNYTAFAYPHPLIAQTVQTTATPAVIQHIASGMECNGVTSLQVTLPNAAGAGNMLLLGIQCSTAATISASSITSKSATGAATTNTWVQDATVTNSTFSQKMTLFRCQNVSANTQIITVPFSGTAVTTVHGTLCVATEVTNIVTSGTVVDSALTAANNLFPGFNTINFTNDFVYYWATDMQSFADSISANPDGPGGFFNGTAMSPPGGFTFLSADRQAGSMDAWAIQSTTQSSGATASVTPATKQWGSISVAYKASTGNAGTAPSPTAMRIVNVCHTLIGNLGVNAPSPAIPLQFPCQGNLLVGTFNGPNAHLSSFTDSNGNPWALPASALNTNENQAQIIYAQNASSSSSLVVTPTLNTGTWQSILLLYDIVNASTTPFDVAATGFGTQSTPGVLSTFAGNNVSSGSTITPTNTNGVVITVVAVNLGTLQDCIVAGNGIVADMFVNLGDNDGGSAPSSPNSTLDEDNGYAHVYNTSTSPITFKYTLTPTSGAAGSWGMAAAAFRAPTGGGPTPLPGTVTLNPGTLLTLHPIVSLRTTAAFTAGTSLSLKQGNIHRPTLTIGAGTVLSPNAALGQPSLEAILTLSPAINSSAVTALFPGIVPNFTTRVFHKAVGNSVPATLMTMLPNFVVATPVSLNPETVLTLVSTDAHGAATGITQSTALTIAAGANNIVAGTLMTISNTLSILVQVQDDATTSIMSNLLIQLISNAIHSANIQYGIGSVLGLGASILPTGLACNFTLGTTMNGFPFVFATPLPPFISISYFPPGNRRHIFER